MRKKILSDFAKHPGNPFIDTSLTWSMDNIIVINREAWHYITQLSDPELRAFLHILRNMDTSHMLKFNTNDGVLSTFYEHMMISENYPGINIDQARAVTVSLLDRQVIARGEKRNQYFVNPKFIFNYYDYCN